jgi:hypothetical protein
MTKWFRGEVHKKGDRGPGPKRGKRSLREISGCFRFGTLVRYQYTIG